MRNQEIKVEAAVSSSTVQHCERLSSPKFCTVRSYNSSCLSPSKRKCAAPRWGEVLCSLISCVAYSIIFLFLLIGIKSLKGRNYFFLIFMIPINANKYLIWLHMNNWSQLSIKKMGNFADKHKRIDTDIVNTQCIHYQPKKLSTSYSDDS